MSSCFLAHLFDPSEGNIAKAHRPMLHHERIERTLRKWLAQCLYPFLAFYQADHTMVCSWFSCFTLRGETNGEDAGPTNAFPFVQCNKAKPGQGLALELCLRLEGAVVVAAGCTTVCQEGGSGNESSGIAQQKLCDVCHLIRRSWSSRRALGEHVLIEISSRAVELIHCKRCHDDAGCDVKWLFSVILSGLLS